MKTKTKIIIASLIGSLGILTMLNLYINETGKQDVVVIDNTTTNQIEGQNSNNTTTTSIIATTKKKTTKKAVKTTKKVSTLNVKYNSKNEIIEYTHNEVLKRWNAGEWEATYNIVMHESGFNPNSWNKKSTACGVFQANPCSKTIKNGYKDYYTNWKTQVQWGLDYIQIKYKTPSNAWEYWQKHHNY